MSVFKVRASVNTPPEYQSGGGGLLTSVGAHLEDDLGGDAAVPQAVGDDAEGVERRQQLAGVPAVQQPVGESLGGGYSGPKGWVFCV